MLLKERLNKIDNIIIEIGVCIKNYVKTSRRYYWIINLCTWHVLKAENLEIIYTFNATSVMFQKNRAIKDVGGETRKQELMNCREWKEKIVVQNILQKGNVTMYIEKLHGFKHSITKYFFQNQKQDKVTMHGVTIVYA